MKGVVPSNLLLQSEDSAASRVSWRHLTQTVLLGTQSAENQFWFLKFNPALTLGQFSQLLLLVLLVRSGLS